MKVLLACDGEYHSYTEAVANAIRVFRAEAEVALVDLGELETEAERFDPQLVIVAGASIPPNPVDERLIAHIELSPESEQPSRFRVGERYWESVNPTLGEILPVVDETGVLYRESQERDPPTDTDDVDNGS